MSTITIPKEKFKNDDLIIIPRKEYEKFLHIFKMIPQDQIWFWTKEWQKKEREADNDIREGKISGPFSSGKELLKSLKSR